MRQRHRVQQEKGPDQVAPKAVCGSLSFGHNKPRVFLALCEVFRDLELDIISVDSTVRSGWFSKLILARNHAQEPLKLTTLRARLSRVARAFDFRTECFVLSEAVPAARFPNIAIFLQAANRVGLLADLLELLDGFGVDIIDINIAVDEAEGSFALLFRVVAPIGTADFYAVISDMREQLGQLGRRLSIEPFNCMVHSTETFAFLQEIDFEAGS